MPPAVTPPVPTYREIFCIRGPHIGRPTALAISPSAHWFSSATDNGDFTISSTLKDTSFHVDMGRLHYVTAIIWVNHQQIILVCVNGPIYVANFNPMWEPMISITKLFSADSLVNALAYNADGKRLAVGRAYDVCIWERIWPAGWHRTHSFEVDLDGSSPSIQSLHFFGINRVLFVGTTAGPMLWSPEGGVVKLELKAPVHIGAAAFAPNDSILAVTTLSASVVIWPVSRKSPLTFWPHKSLLKAAEGLSAFEPHYPVAVTQDRHVICGTTDGSVIVFSHNANCLQTLARHAHCTRLILATNSIFVAAFTDAASVVTHAGYTNNKETYEDHMKKRAEHLGMHPEVRFHGFDEVYKQLAPALESDTRGLKRNCLCRCTTTGIVIIIVLVVYLGSFAPPVENLPSSDM